MLNAVKIKKLYSNLYKGTNRRRDEQNT